MTAVDLRAALWTLLSDVTMVNVFDGVVPEAPPADVDGGVWPYWVLWAGAGAPLDRDRHGALDDGPVPALDFVARITVVARDPATVVAATTVLRSTIAGQVLVAGATRLYEATPADQQVTRDDDVTPPRFYLPTLWRCSSAT